MSGTNTGKTKFASLLLLFQGILMILFVVFVDYGNELLPADPGKGKRNNPKETKGNLLLVLSSICYTGALMIVILHKGRVVFWLESGDSF